MKSIKRFLITSALPYANGGLHLGHLAGAYLPADIYARYLRAFENEVLFICGSDEHGTAITTQAKLDGVSPHEIIDKFHSLNKKSFERLGISFDYYHRTSDPLHHKTAQEFFLNLLEKNGQIIKQDSKQYFDEKFQQFLADRYIMGGCPHCGNHEAYGDQCEKCGRTLSPLELIDPVSKLSGISPVLRETNHWYFCLDKHTTWLTEWLKSGTIDGVPHHDPNLWKKHVINQCFSWLEEGDGLQPRAITRDLDWGIPVPLPDGAGKVLYVWFDAPIGYISATKKWAQENGKDWESWWKDESTKLVHFIGKDNIVFHCIVFPAMLKAHGEFILPINVPANQFLNFEGQKFSKSNHWGIEQHTYLEEFEGFPNKEDALRWVLIRTLPETKDSDFRWDSFIEYHDKDLAFNLGNFVNRVLVLTKDWFNYEVPQPPNDLIGNNLKSTIEPILELCKKLCTEIEEYNFRSAASRVMEISDWGNQYLQICAPWVIRKENPNSEEISKCLFISLQVVTLLSSVIEPFIPFTSIKIRKLLNVSSHPNDLKINLGKLNAGLPILNSKHIINEPEILFEKIKNKNNKTYLDIIEFQKSKLIDSTKG